MNADQGNLDSLVESFSNIDLWVKILLAYKKNDTGQNFMGTSPNSIIFRNIKPSDESIFDRPAKSFSIKFLNYYIDKYILLTLVRDAYTAMPISETRTKGDATVDRVQIAQYIDGISVDEARKLNSEKLKLFFSSIGRFYSLEDINIRVSTILIGRAI